MPTSTQIGDSQAVSRHGSVSTIAVTEVALTELTDATSFLNTTRESGKTAGSMIVAELGTGVKALFIAGGSEPTDVWYCQRGTDADSEANDITPA